MQTLTMDPKNIVEHELLKRLPPVRPDDPEVIKIASSIQELGRLIYPLKVTEDGRLVDGRRRLAAARRLKLAEVPCDVVDEKEAAELIVFLLSHRAHYTKGQQAYLIMPFIQEAFESARNRRLTNLSAGIPTVGNAGGVPETNSSSFREKRVEDYASKIGVTLRYLQQAQQLWKFFEDEKTHNLTDDENVTEKDVTFREFFEPRILREDSPYGLGAALTGIKTHLALEAAAAKGRKHTGGKPKEIAKQLALFNRIVSDSLARFEYWEKWDPQTRTEHWIELRLRARKIAPERARSMGEYFARVAKEFKRAAKAAKENA